ncbi:DUF2695 domain-containing protein [Hymenobacter edaphi]|uniref:DUF2695 domain-containing protein n=1 Tax=Hymenobacter edaphi TaxID=2211146 RepID=A0A328BM96_9BACT|nr:DUF2695 domain-containing protein [Hymenobacter edaphi]RAK67064.1 hypothetical protein DLM85_12770 [Hymenobacter edaphi]
MPTPTDKTHRQQLRLQLRQQHRTALLTNLPLTTEQLAELFDYLDARLSTHCCDDTLGHTRCFAAAQDLAFAPLQQFLQQHGGHCDCEVLANVADAYATIL